MDEKNIEAAVKLVIKEYEKEKETERKKKVYHNTFLLMKKYNLMKSHIEEVTENIEDGIGIDLDLEDIWVLSIVKSKVKSLKMLAYIDSALRIIEAKYGKEGIIHEYVAFKKYFIDEKTNEEIMSELNCGKNSPKKWSDKVLNELGILLWGYEALGI